MRFALQCCNHMRILDSRSRIPVADLVHMAPQLAVIVTVSKTNSASVDPASSNGKN